MRTGGIKLIGLLFLSLLLVGQAPPAAPPSIEAISPSSGRAGTGMEITGRQFTADNIIVFGDMLIQHVGIASAIGIACTSAPNCRSGILQKLKFMVPAKAVPGSTKVSVKNANGASNAVDFTVLK